MSKVHLININIQLYHYLQYETSKRNQTFAVIHNDTEQSAKINVYDVSKNFTRKYRRKDRGKYPNLGDLSYY